MAEDDYIMFRALMVQLLRSGKVDRSDIEAAATELEHEGHDSAAHNVRCLTLHADAPSTSEWYADRKRRRQEEYNEWLAKKRKPDGGNPT